MNTNKKALLAIAMVALMLAVPFTVISDSEQADAASYWPTKPSYTYTMDFSDPHNITVKSGSNVMVSSTSASTNTVAALNALTSHTDQVYKMSDAGTLTAGSLVVAANDLVKYDSASKAWVKCTAWSWSNGVGPFGMFYAAVSLGAEDDYAISTTPGHIAYILDPTNLSQALKYKENGTIKSGTHSYTIGDYNVMLVIPTVYWSVSGTTLKMGNTSASGVAYAHTADGTTYPYLAIGVYEAYADNDLGLLSKSGVTSSASRTIDQFRSYVDIGNSLITDKVGTYQMWNFYEWTLYKIMAETYISSFDSQTMAGQGANSGHGTGSTNTSGPATTPGDNKVDKLLIENAWKGVWEFVDNTYVSDGVFKAGSGLANQLSSTNVKISGEDYTGGTLTIGEGTATQTIATFSQEASSFGMPLTAGDSDTAIPDAFRSKASGDMCLAVGGHWLLTDTAGLSAWITENPLGVSVENRGARLAYLMSADAANTTVANRVVSFVESDHTSYQSVSPGSSVTLFRAEDSSEGVFAGWYTDAAKTVSAGPINSPYTPAGNVILYAKYDPVATVAFYEWNGNAYSDTAGQSYSGLVSGESVMIPGANSPTVTASNITYEFVGWYKAGTAPTTQILTTGQTNYANTLYDVGDLTAATAVNMYAVYAPVSETVDVTFKTVADDTGFAVSYAKDAYVQLPVLPDNETGRFVGWSIAAQTAGGDVQELVSQTNYQATADAVLYAQYAALTGKVTATFYDATGTAIASSTIAPGFTTDANGQIKYNEGQVIGLPAFSAASGTTFVGWYTAASDGSLIGVPGDVFAITSDTSFYAVCATTYTVTFTNGTDSITISGIAGERVQAPNMFSSEAGKLLQGYYTDSTSQAIVATYGTWIEIPANDTTYTAVFMDVGSGGSSDITMYDVATDIIWVDDQGQTITTAPFDVTFSKKIASGSYGLVSVKKNANYAAGQSVVLTLLKNDDSGEAANANITQIDGSFWMISSVLENVKIKATVSTSTETGMSAFYVSGTADKNNQVRVVLESESDAGLAAGSVTLGGTYKTVNGQGQSKYGAITEALIDTVDGQTGQSKTVAAGESKISSVFGLKDSKQAYYVYATYTVEGSAVCSMAVLTPALYEDDN